MADEKEKNRKVLLAHMREAVSRLEAAWATLKAGEDQALDDQVRADIWAGLSCARRTLVVLEMDNQTSETSINLVPLR